MRKIFSFLIPVSLITLITGCTAKTVYRCRPKEQSLSEYFAWKTNADKPLIMAHRNGPQKGIPENSIAALENTYKIYPCAIQEIDVRMTKDSQLVLMHDTTIDRTTTGKGKVNELLYAELKQYELKDELGNVLKGNHIPLFDEVLEKAAEKILLALDMKPGTDPARMMKSVERFNALKNVFVICYSIPEAQQLHATYPDVMIALGFNDWEKIAAIEKSGIPYKNLIALTPVQVQGKKFYDKIHSMGIMVSFGTYANTDTLPGSKVTIAYKKAWEAGANIFSTDSVNKVAALFY